MFRPRQLCCSYCTANTNHPQLHTLHQLPASCGRKEAAALNPTSLTPLINPHLFLPLLLQVRMQIWPRLAGVGITASPLITQLCELAGIQNVTIKVTGRRRNVCNVVHTFMEALLGQSLPHDGVEGSGVYMREVWHGRELPCGLKRGVHVP
jgi:hypothetical protein